MIQKLIAKMLGVWLAILAILVIAGPNNLWAAPAKTLKIGCTLPLNISMGLELKKCLELLVDDLNNSGGLVIKGQPYKVEMIIYDDKYAADGGRAGIERLVYTDKVKFIVNQWGSAPSLAGLPVTEQNKMIVFFAGVSERLSDPQYKYVFYSRHLMVRSHFVYLTKKHPELKTMVVFVPDNETGRFNAKSEGDVAKRFGLTVLPPVFFPRDTVDFTPFATKIKTMNPNMVDYWGSLEGTQLGLQLKAIHQSGWRGIQMQSLIKMDEVLPVAGKAPMEGLYLSWPDNSDLPEPPMPAAKLRKLYEAKYGAWCSTALTWVNSWFQFITAIKKADSIETKDVLAAMNGLVFEGTLGRCQMHKRPDLGNSRYVNVITPSWLGQVRDGKMELVEATSLDTTKKALETMYGHKGQWW